MAERIKTRFAPSPTGYLHVGGARTALFNYLLARRAGGTLLLRIEDTDRARHDEAAVVKIIEDLRWLGIDWDEGVELGPSGRLAAKGPNGPYRQSERLDVYRKYVDQLLEAGRAYHAFDTPAELEAMRAAARAEKRGFRYPRPDPLPTGADADKVRAEGRPVVVRFLCPNEDVAIHDEAFGEVTWPAAEQDDFIILKDDGYPTYHLANVVDDALMGVTYVMRGQEFLGQTWRQKLLREALGFDEPRYCHLPLILNTDNSKLSKRDKAKAARQAARQFVKDNGRDALSRLLPDDVGDLDAFLDKKTDDAKTAESLAGALGVALPEIEVHDFRRAGYLPEALVNFIALLGWRPGGNREKLTVGELIELFGVDRIGKANAKFDRDKLLAFNTDAAAAAEEDRLLAGFTDYLALNPDAPGPIPTGDEGLLRRLLRVNKGLRTFADIPARCGVLFAPDDAFEYDDKAVGKVLRKGGGAGYRVLADLRGRLAECQWTAEALETLLRDYCQANELGMGKVAQPIRVAVTGTTVSPAIFDTLMLLGREKTLARIDRCLAQGGADGA